MNKPTRAQADLFDDLVAYWQAELGLKDWRIERSPRPGRRGVMAEVVKIDVAQHSAQYRLGQHFGDAPITADVLNALACHEMLHVLLAEFYEVSRSDGAPAELIEAAEHRVINILEQLLVGKR